jgi:hypothetical protein
MIGEQAIKLNFLLKLGVLLSTTSKTPLCTAISTAFREKPVTRNSWFSILKSLISGVEKTAAHISILVPRASEWTKANYRNHGRGCASGRDVEGLVQSTGTKWSP